MDKNDFFDAWLYSLDITLPAWQKEVLRVACTQPHKKLYISMPRCCGRHLTLKLIEQYEQMIKGEKKMAQKKLDNFDMKDIHSGYVVKFRNGKLALCMRVGEKFTKIFAIIPDTINSLSLCWDVREGEDFFYSSRYKGHAYYTYDVVRKVPTNDPTYDIVEVYGLVEGVNNYPLVGTVSTICRPLLWEENVVEMTLEDIEKKLGYKVKIVSKQEPAKEYPIKCDETCRRCARYAMHSKCKGLSDKKTCYDCKKTLGISKCPCGIVDNGQPCPYYEEETT